MATMPPTSSNKSSLPTATSSWKMAVIGGLALCIPLWLHLGTADKTSSPASENMTADSAPASSDDEKTDFALAKQRAEEFDSSGCGYLAVAYAYGMGGATQDLGLAHYWLEACADDSDEQIRATREDLKATMQVSDYVKAAELGLMPAMLELAKRYHDGTGTPKDNVEALKWLRMYGHPEDGNIQSLQNAIMVEMSPEEIARAESQFLTIFAKAMKEAGLDDENSH